MDNSLQFHNFHIRLFRIHMSHKLLLFIIICSGWTHHNSSVFSMLWTSQWECVPRNTVNNESLNISSWRQFPRCCWLHPFSVCFTVGYQAQTAAEFSGAVKTDSKTRNTQWGQCWPNHTKPAICWSSMVFACLCSSEPHLGSQLPGLFPFVQKPMKFIARMIPHLKISQDLSLRSLTEGK